MATNNTVAIVILVALLAFPEPGLAQESQEAFSSNLIEACQGNDISKIQTQIQNHRLWVKPVVNQLISEYIDLTLAGDEPSASSKKNTANLISRTFLETYGEKSLSIGVGYLDEWDEEDLKKKAEADQLYAHATNLRKSGQQSEEAIRTFLSALALYIDIEDIRGQGEVLGGLGYMYFNTNPDTSLYFYKKALIARKQVDDKYLVGGTLNTIGLLYYYYTDSLRVSIDYFEKAAIVREEIGHWSGMGASLSVLGEAYKYNGEPEKAFKTFQKSYTIHKKAGDSFRMAEAILRSGTLLIKMGRYPQALDHLNVSLDISRELSDTLLLGDVNVQLALTYAYLGDFDTAIKNATTAFAMYQTINDYWGLAGAYNNTGLVLHEVGRVKKASEYYKKSLAIYTELEDKEHLVILSNNIGTTEFDLGNFTTAEEYHQQAFRISREIQSDAGELSSLINLANVQNRLGKLDEALSNYESALILSRKLNSPDTEWRVLVGLAENYKLKGDFDRAIEYNEAGLSMIEELRSTLHSEEYRSSYLARERFAFEEVIHMLGEMHVTDRGKGYDLLAFNYAQRCKSRSFLDQLESSNSRSSEIGGDTQADPVSLQDVQNSDMGKHTVLLEYSLGDSCSYLWIISKDQHQMIRLPDRKTLQDQVESFRFAILNPDQENMTFLQESGLSLYQQLVQPAEPYISKKSKLVILPDGILHYVPFEVLITSDSKPDAGNPYSRLPYLAKKYPISYGQSSSVLKSMMEERTEIKGSDQELNDLIAFGDPVYTFDNTGSDMLRTVFNRLVHSGDEVESIAALFTSSNAEIYLREKASEENVKKVGGISHFKYLHFATHGIVDEQDPGKSSLVLSQENNTKEDGFLHAAEISDLELNADLAVLSACQTGLGKMVRGEGMIGLSRSIMYAGVPSVVVSLWSVSDESTNILMERFYENLITKGLSKTEALHLAQISMINDEQYAHPFFWAPFILIGDWQ